MKKKRKIWFIIIIFCAILVMPISYSLSQSETKTNFSYQTILKNDKTLFNLKLLKGSVALLGRENWKKGDSIRIHVSNINSDSSHFKIGILRAEDQSKGWGYNDYGEALVMKRFSQDDNNLEFIVPNDGQYGLIVRNDANDTILGDILSFVKANYSDIAFEINREFHNPLTQKEKT